MFTCRANAASEPVCTESEANVLVTPKSAAACAGSITVNDVLASEKKKGLLTATCHNPRLSIVAPATTEVAVIRRLSLCGSVVISVD